MITHFGATRLITYATSTASHLFSLPSKPSTRQCLQEALGRAPSLCLAIPSIAWLAGNRPDGSLLKLVEKQNRSPTAGLIIT